jgi:replication fork clamp-binding protein CrfC
MNHADSLVPKLQEPVERLLQLLGQELSLAENIDVSLVQTSLRKAITPKFEIVFAGVFSAGKSMLINALLERELLYSAEGHATGTECQIAYADPHKEQVLLTFLSLGEIQEQVNLLCQPLGCDLGDIRDQDARQYTYQNILDIIQQEGGESKSEKAKRAAALKYLLQGFQDNRQHIEPAGNTTLSMEQIHCGSLHEAASYVRRGSNSAVLKRVEYYCHHPLLKDGNVFIDTPGIDAPVKRDAEWTYRKIEDSDTSAVICVLKAASAGDLTSEETELLEKTRANPGIRDRVFYVFNRIDESWYNAQLKQRLAQLIQEQFYDSYRVYKTSGLLGFYGSQLRKTSAKDRYGLESIFADSVRQAGGSEETPQFVNEFNRYCANSGKLPASRFRIEVKSYESANENYARILNEGSSDLIEQLIHDSGIETFRTAITRYLTKEKRPLLLKNLIEDLTPICTKLRQFYLEAAYSLQSQPQNVEALKEQGLSNLSKELKTVGDSFQAHIEDIINEITASNNNSTFEADFRKLKARMVSRLDELLNTFSVSSIHQRAQATHRRNTVVPLLGILAEAFYYLANGLEEVLVDASQQLTANFFRHLYT